MQERREPVTKVIFSVVVAAATRPLPRDEGMVGDHGAPEAGKLSPDVVERQRAAKERAVQSP